MSKTVKITDIKAGETFYMAPMYITAEGVKEIGTIFPMLYLSKVSKSVKEPLVKMWHLHSWYSDRRVSEVFKFPLLDNRYSYYKTKEYKRYKDAVKAQHDFLKYHIVTEEEIESAVSFDEFAISFDSDED